MKRFFYPAKALLAGLVVAQIISTFFVYQSNIALKEKLEALLAGGYLIVPNETVLSRLDGFWPAFYGGVFFTLSTGAAMALFGVGAAWFWHRFLHRRPLLMVAPLIPWIAGLAAVNLNGINWTASALILFVPPPVFGLTIRWMPAPTENRPKAAALYFVLPLLLLGLFWLPLADQDIFLDIRDFLLLSTRTGQWLNRAYYNNTFFAAEVIKSFDQKILKTCRPLPKTADPKALAKIKKALAAYDYLPLDGGGAAMDLELDLDGQTVRLKHKGRLVLETGLDNFIKKTGGVLKEFSDLTDNNAGFRRLIIISILGGSAPVLYLLLFASINYGLGLFLKGRWPALGAGLICLAIGLALLAPVMYGRMVQNKKVELNELLTSDSWRDRVAGLRTIALKKMDISRYPDYRTLLTSPNIPERYWLTKSFGYGRDEKTYEDLLKMLKDPNPNVVSKAYDSLGARRKSRAVPIILEGIKTSDQWFIQWYAYRALRKLGWKQKISTSKS